MTSLTSSQLREFPNFRAKCLFLSKLHLYTCDTSAYKRLKTMDLSFCILKRECQAVFARPNRQSFSSQTFDYSGCWQSSRGVRNSQPREFTIRTAHRYLDIIETALNLHETLEWVVGGAIGPSTVEDTCKLRQVIIVEGTGNAE